MKLDNVIPNLVIIGDSAYDTNKFYYDDGNTMIKTNFGGSSIYASIPASVFFRVGLVSNAGEDFELDKLQPKSDKDYDNFPFYKNFIILIVTEHSFKSM